MRHSTILIPLLALTILMIASACWTWLVFETNRIDAYDRELMLAMFEWAPTVPWLRPLMLGFTWLGSWPSLTILSVVGLMWRLRRRDRRFALIWVLATLPSGLLISELKGHFDRARPGLEYRDRAAMEENASYPSGHSMGSAVNLGIWAIAAWRFGRTPRERYGWVAVVVASVALVGASRIFFRVHWFSDVIAGFLMGATWLAFVMVGEVLIMRAEKRVEA